MCGHVGIAGVLEHRDEATMKRLLLFDVFRGMDSTGFAAMKHSGDCGIAKLPSHPIDLFQHKKFEQLLAGSQSKVFLGHNRAATLGKVTGANAHPFIFGDTVGAHNGTLDILSWQRLDKIIGHSTNVDSAAIMECIDMVGIEATIAEMETGETMQRGAWALVWFDTAKNTLNFIRNKHRPMWYALAKDKKKLFWGSEWEIISAALSMAVNAYELDTSDEGYSYFEMEADWLYSFDLDKLKDGGYGSVEEARVQKLEGREPPKAVTTVGGAPFQRPNTTSTTQTPNGGRTQTSTTSTTTSHGGHSHDGSSNVVDIWTAREHQPYADYADEERFKELAKYGCSWCQVDIEYGEVGVTIYDEYEMILCPECAGNNGHNRIYLEPTAHENLQKAV